MIWMPSPHGRAWIKNTWLAEKLGFSASYHGLGSGIKRALKQWSQIEFADDHDGCLFRVTVTRKPVEVLDLVESGAPGNERRAPDAPKNAPKGGKDAPEIADLKGHSGHLSGQRDPINELLNKIQELPNADYVTLALVVEGNETLIECRVV